jgi:S-adenosylmethionine synthetase
MRIRSAERSRIESENNTPIAIANLVISTHHAPSLSLRDLRYQLIAYVMKPLIPDRILSHQVSATDWTARSFLSILLAPSWLEGPKPMPGGRARRSSSIRTAAWDATVVGHFPARIRVKSIAPWAYMACYIAKSVVAAELADVCEEEQIAYVIGHAHPVCVRVETVNPSVSNNKISQAIEDVFDMRPAAFIERLNLLRPIYWVTAAYGHLGRPEFPWEASDCLIELQRP